MSWVPEAGKSFLFSVLPITGMLVSSPAGNLGWDSRPKKELTMLSSCLVAWG